MTNSAGVAWTSQGEDLNGAGCNGEFYIDSVMVHEVGHGLGLGHSTDTTATMRPSLDSCNNTLATIETDDRNGLRATTPPPVVDQQCNADCEAEADNCLGFYGGQDPAIVQRCDIQLEQCRDWCMCN